MIVVAIGLDPGLSFGVRRLLLDDTGRVQARAPIQATPAAAIRAYVFELEEYHRLKSRNRNVTIVVGCERYYGRAGTDAQRKTIGGVFAAELLAESFNAPFLLQNPTDAKSFATVERMRQLGLYLRGRDVNRPDANDARDATRHALLALATNHLNVYDALLKRHGVG